MDPKQRFFSVFRHMLMKFAKLNRMALSRGDFQCSRTVMWVRKPNLYMTPCSGKYWDHVQDHVRTMIGRCQDHVRTMCRDMLGPCYDHVRTMLEPGQYHTIFISHNVDQNRTFLYFESTIRYSVPKPSLPNTSLLQIYQLNNQHLDPIFDLSRKAEIGSHIFESVSKSSNRSYIYLIIFQTHKIWCSNVTMSQYDNNRISYYLNIMIGFRLVFRSKGNARHF